MAFLQRRKLRKVLLGDDAEARSNAAEKLSELGWQPESTEERAAFLVEQGKLHDAAGLGSVAVRFLGQAMLKATPHTCVEIAEILGQLGDSQGVPYLLKTLEEGDCWVAIGGGVLATEASRGMVDRMGTLFPSLSGIGGMIDMGGARIEVRKACEDALIAIANRGVNILSELAQLKSSPASWARESVTNVLNAIGKA